MSATPVEMEHHMAELVILLKIVPCPTKAESLQYTRPALIEIIGDLVMVCH